MIIKTFEIICFHFFFLNFASLFLLFADLLTGLVKEKFNLLYSKEKSLCSKFFFSLHFDVVTMCF